MLYSGKSFQQRATSGLAFKLSGMQLVDAVEDNLGVEGICNVLKDEDSPCEGVAFRHYSAHKAWKNVAGMLPQQLSTLSCGSGLLSRFDHA